MKNSIAIGALALSSIFASKEVLAQQTDGVTLYGLIDAGITYVSNESGHSNLKFDDGILVPNLLGIRGSENLGGGLHAVFNLVDQFSLGTGKTIQQGLFGRSAYVGISDDHWGTITLGNQSDFMFDSLLLCDAANNIGFYGFRSGPFNKINIPINPPYAGAFNWDRMTGSQPISNSVKYQSPNIGGFKFGALYAFGGVPGSLGSGNSVSIGVNYDSGPLGLAAAYTNIKYYNAGQPQVGIRNWGIGAHYTIGATTLTGLVTTVRNSFNGAAIAEAEAGINYQLAPEWVLVGGYMYMKGNAVLNNNHAHQIDMSVDYILSKRTMLYVQGIFQRANSGANALINGILDPNGASSGSTQSLARIGIKTIF